MVALVACTVLMTACTKSPAGTGSTTSTVTSTSPWTGSFVAVALPNPLNSMTGTACPTSQDCWAVGSTVGNGAAPNGAAVITTTDGGREWSSQVIPPTAGFLSGISCVDRHRCVAVGQSSQNGQGAAITTANGGTTWAPALIPAGVVDVTTVTCRPDGQCVAIGQLGAGDVALVSATAGAAWTQAGPLPSGVTGGTGVSCSDDQHCWVTAGHMVDADHVAGVVTASSDGGATWTTLPTPVGAGFLNAVSCLQGAADLFGALPTISVPTTAPTSSPRVPGGSSTSTSAASTTSPASTTPASTSSIPPPVGIAGVRCTVVGTTANGQGDARTGHGLILTTENGGATWSAPTAPASAAVLFDVACTAVDTCVSVGSTVLASPAAGIVVFTGPVTHPWQKPSVVTMPQSLSSTACASTSHCVAAGEAITAYLSGT